MHACIHAPKGCQYLLFTLLGQQLLTQHITAFTASNAWLCKIR